MQRKNTRLKRRCANPDTATIKGRILQNPQGFAPVITIQASENKSAEPLFHLAINKLLICNNLQNCVSRPTDPPYLREFFSEICLAPRLSFTNLDLEQSQLIQANFKAGSVSLPEENPAPFVQRQ